MPSVDIKEQVAMLNAVRERRAKILNEWQMLVTAMLDRDKRELKEWEMPAASGKTRRVRFRLP